MIVGSFMFGIGMQLGMDVPQTLYSLGGGSLFHDFNAFSLYCRFYVRGISFAVLAKTTFASSISLAESTGLGYFGA